MCKNKLISATLYFGIESPHHSRISHQVRSGHNGVQGIQRTVGMTEGPWQGGPVTHTVNTMQSSEDEHGRGRQVPSRTEGYQHKTDQAIQQEHNIMQTNNSLLSLLIAATTLVAYRPSVGTASGGSSKQTQYLFHYQNNLTIFAM